MINALYHFLIQLLSMISKMNEISEMEFYAKLAKMPFFT